MSLKGSLKTVALPEVLHLLSSTGKSGEFHVSGSQREGRLWFEDGRIAGFEAGRAERTSEAIFELLRIDDGDFTFAADAERPEGVRVVSPEDGEVALALEAAEEHLIEWNGIVEVVPSLAHRVQLRGVAPQEQVVLEAEQWAMVVAVGDGRSVSDVLEACEKGEFDGCRAIRVLVEASLVDVLEPAEDAEPAAVEFEAEVVDFEAAIGADGEGEAELDDPARFDLNVEAEVADKAYPAEEAEPAQEAESAQEAPFGEEVLPADDAVFVEAAFDSDPLGTGETSFSQFPVMAVDPAEENPYEAYGAIGDGAFAGSQTDGTPGTTTEEEDRYAALRAAMVEVGENLVEYTGDAADDTSGLPVYELESDPQMEGRAALQALLSEVTTPSEQTDVPVAAYEVVDGLADRGPWTEHELSAMDTDSGWAEADAGPSEDHPSNIVPFAPVHAIEEEPVDAAEPTEAENAPEPAPAGEPMNRGLLLKFLSSVRN